MGASETHGDAKTHMDCKIMHSSIKRGSPTYMPWGLVMFEHTHKFDALTQAFPELPAGIQGSEIKDWGGCNTLPHSDASIQ